ncbi:hypothetical protein KI387_000035 [Taxus chinensis]|uniref:Protein kinase domain-containing protein n=1 Tax=Taxus chinensis TaxID=29808 RepID=A0AA38GRX5_TAXCH|nr:hypothetical protein KI387_000035 [Taxus chinensis]
MGMEMAMTWVFLTLVILILGGEGTKVEVGVLVEMKAALDPGGKILYSWVKGGDPCSGSFEGVACNERGKVTNISLQGYGLSGSIPPAVARLKCLSGLYLHYNSLHGEIPKQLSDLKELVDLYLNVNMLSGFIPKEFGSMYSLQALQLCCNELTGPIPMELGSLKKLTVLALQNNDLSGAIPASLGGLSMLTRLDLSFNSLFGPIPRTLSTLPQLTILDVRNNSLSGNTPKGLKGMREGFQYGNNSELCGEGFAGLRQCKSSVSLIRPEPLGSEAPNITGRVPKDSISPLQKIPESADLPKSCKNCPKAPKPPGVAIVLGVIAVISGGIMASVFIFSWFRRRKQKISSAYETTESRLSIDNSKDVSKKCITPLISLDYSNDWDPLAHGGTGSQNLQSFRYNLEEIESATQYFSEKNLLGRNNYSAAYKGVLRDGSVVAIKTINKMSCKTEELEFQEGLKSLLKLRHANVVRLRGFCCSRGRGECFLVYDFAPNGNLLQFLDAKDGKHLDWSARVRIAHGIAKGIEYLHEGMGKAVVHQNISAKKILLDQHMNPLLSDCGLHKLLADDIVYSILKASVGMGYLAPEYTSIGRLMEKNDVYAFGIILLQLITGEKISSTIRPLVETGKLEEFIDINLGKNYSKTEACNLAKIALDCTTESPNQRPAINVVMQQLCRIDEEQT